MADASTWVDRQSRWLRVAIGALGVVVLLWGNDVSLSRLFWSLALVAFLLAIVQVLIGAAHGSQLGRAEPEPTSV